LIELIATLMEVRCLYVSHSLMKETAGIGKIWGFYIGPRNLGIKVAPALLA